MAIRGSATAEGTRRYRDRMVEVLVRRALTAAKDELESGMSNE